MSLMANISVYIDIKGGQEQCSKIKEKAGLEKAVREDQKIH